MKQEDRDAIERSCRSLLHDYAVAVDRGDADAMLALFAENGVLRRGELELRGRAELPRILQGRPADMVMRHLLTTVSVAVRDADHAEAVSYYLLYNGRGTGLPLPFEAPFSLGDWASSFVRTPSGWRLASHEVRRVFVRPPAAPAEGRQSP